LLYDGHVLAGIVCLLGIRHEVKSCLGDVGGNLLRSFSDTASSRDPSSRAGALVWLCGS
jgi:hypothetical protein